LAHNIGPVPGGYELDRIEFYICRVYHEGHLLIGKYFPDEDKCMVGFDGGEKEYKEGFSVLTNPRNEAKLRWVAGNGKKC